MVGNDLATLPNFPAEIRAPAGTLAGVSAFQIHFASRDILTPGDQPNVLVAMNPAALKANLAEVPRGATVIVNEDAFSKRNLEKAGYTPNPLEDGSLERVPRAPDPNDVVDGRGGRRDRGLLDSRRGPSEEPVRAWGPVVVVRPADGRDQEVDRAEVRPESGGVAREPGGVQRGLVVRRDNRVARRPVQGQACDRCAAGYVPECQRHDRAVAGADRGERPERAAFATRELSDHSGVRDPARALTPRDAWA